MSARARARALLRTQSSLVSVCMRTGNLRAQAPALSYVRQQTKSKPLTDKDPHQFTFSLEESLRYVEDSLAEGELRATNVIKRGVLKMRADLERMEELLLLEEADHDLVPQH
jgi:hypothetical protein